MEADNTPTLVNKKRGYIGTVEVDCNAIGPVTKEERHAATKIMDRIIGAHAKRTRAEGRILAIELWWQTKTVRLGGTKRNGEPIGQI